MSAPLTGRLCSSVSQPLRINGVKVYTENVDKRQIIMDLQIRWHHCDEFVWFHSNFYLNWDFGWAKVFIFSLSAMLEILKLMWMSKGTTVEQGSKVYRYIVFYWTLKSHFLYICHRKLLCCVIHYHLMQHLWYGYFHWVSQGYMLMCWIQWCSCLYCDANTCFMEGILVAWTEPIFTERVCVYL